MYLFWQDITIKHIFHLETIKLSQYHKNQTIIYHRKDWTKILSKNTFITLHVSLAAYYIFILS